MPELPARIKTANLTWRQLTEGDRPEYDTATAKAKDGPDPSDKPEWMQVSWGALDLQWRLSRGYSYGLWHGTDMVGIVNVDPDESDPSMVRIEIDPFPKTVAGQFAQEAEDAVLFVTASCIGDRARTYEVEVADPKGPWGHNDRGSNSQLYDISELKPVEGVEMVGPHRDSGVFPVVSVDRPYTGRD